MVVLRDHSYAEILVKKRELLAELRKNRVFVLERGAIEAYYPDGVEGPDKPSKAQSFCKMINSKEQAIGL